MRLPSDRPLSRDDFTLQQAIDDALIVSSQNQMPATVYRNDMSGGWWRTNPFAPFLNDSEVFVTILPLRFFN